MRGPWARRLRDVFESHLSDLGPEDASEAKRSIVRRAAVLTVELERIETRFAEGRGSDSDLDLYQRTAGNLRRLLESVGLERRPREVETLESYLASEEHRAAVASAVDASDGPEGRRELSPSETLASDLPEAEAEMLR